MSRAAEVPAAQGVVQMGKKTRMLMLGVLVVLAVVMTGASGNCNFGNNSDCLFFCS